ncbi:hypothetical protein [Silanimonas sp.]|uniref:hypothetical protein n=1 Tax=Silanimonas sp. TaxID=1929290 RepID=UPI0022C71AD3|nr:hypothetical protein [Silanimonas sp.]MCZ8165669.1 hypothetical protein [Silanimonas sp.]
MSYPVPAPRCASALLALALSATLLAGCQPAAEAPTLSTHAVPPARAQAIVEAINKTLMQGDAPPLGRAEVAAPGTLVVRAPSGMQASIASTISALQGVEAAEPVQVQVEAWWIGKTPEAAPLPAELADVAKALGGNASTLRVRDHVRLGVAASGRLANANGDAMLMSVRAAPEGDTFVLGLRIAQARADVARVGGPLHYDGEVRVVPGEFTVLTSRPDGSDGSESLVLRLTN